LSSSLTICVSYKRAICFEISEHGRKRLKANAELNGVADKIEIHGEANMETLAPILANIDSGVVLCDIEGAKELISPQSSERAG
jgi:tRNA G37 N-methylase Trm5